MVSSIVVAAAALGRLVQLLHHVRQAVGGVRRLVERGGLGGAAEWVR